MKLRSRRGIALLAALGMALVMAVVARGVLVMNPSLQANHSKTQKRALEAAMSGMEYAKSRLGADPGWKANVANQVVVSSPGLTVIEDRGNVIGVLTLDDGSKSRFRLRFNYQDGTGGPDGLDDPSLAIPMTELCYNNILSDGAVNVPSASAPSYSVEPGGPTTELPGQAVVLAVQGEAGLGIADLTSEQVNEEPSGFTHKELVRAVLAAEVDLPAGDAVVMAGGGIDMTVAPGEKVVLAASDDTPRARTKKGITLRESGGEADLLFEGAQSEVGFDENLGMSANIVGSNVPSENNEFVSDGLDFYNLSFDEVKKADSSPSTSEAVQLPGGVYVLWSKDEIRYYDMAASEALEMLNPPQPEWDQDTPPTPPELPPADIVITSSNFAEVRTPENVTNNPEGIEFSAQAVNFDNPLLPPSGPFDAQGDQGSSTGGAEGILSISKDLFVLPSATGNQDFAIVTRDLSTQAQNPNGPMMVGQGQGVPTDEQVAVALQVQNSTVSCQGDMLLRAGQLQLQEATLTGTGSLNFQTMELTTTAGQDNLSVYFQGNVTISSYNPTFRRFGKLDLAGTLYSQGNIDVLAGDEALGTNRWGEFTLDGNIVAYGGEPSQGTPGASGGLFSMMAKKARLSFDPTSVAGLFDLEPGFPETVSLQISSYNVSSR